MGHWRLEVKEGLSREPLAQLLSGVPHSVTGEESDEGEAVVLTVPGWPVYRFEGEVGACTCSGEGDGEPVLVGTLIDICRELHYRHREGGI
tara:strand:- start:233 stop:505 length:273 start_codon:yes stop_codon:yes gene_type:complete